jgi:hypothetical protein
MKMRGRTESGAALCGFFHLGATMPMVPYSNL